MMGAPKTAPAPAMIRPSPTTDGRAARYTAPASAPAPDADPSSPSVRAPAPGRDSASANTGISTLSDGIPARLITAMNTSSTRMGLNPQTYRNPSTSSARTPARARVPSAG